MSTSAGTVGTDDLWDDDAGWDDELAEDEWDEFEGEDDDGRRYLGDVDLPLVDLPSVRDLVADVRDGAVMAEMVELVRGDDAGTAAERTVDLDLPVLAERQRRSLVEQGAHLLASMRAVRRLAESMGRTYVDDDGAVLAAWVFVATGWLNLLCRQPVENDDPVEVLVGDVWVTVTLLLHEGCAVTRSGLLTTMCQNLHEGRGRHHDTCGLAQRDVWLAARRLQHLGALTIVDDTVTMTDLGRYGMHRWVTDLGGHAPVRLGRAEPTQGAWVT